MTTEGALDLPALAEVGMPNAAFHFTSIRVRGPGAVRAESALPTHRNESGSDAEVFTAESMIVLRVVPLVAQELINGMILHGLPNRGRKLRRVLAGADANERGGP